LCHSERSVTNNYNALSTTGKVSSYTFWIRCEVLA